MNLKKLREAKQELREHGYILEKKEQLDEGVLAIAGGVALGLLALKVVGKIVGFGLKGLLSLLIEGNKAEIAAEIAEIAEIKDKLLANPEITDAIEKGELTKKLVKNSIEREFRSLIAKQYNRALDNSIKMSECSI